jgi:hypothetical protein
MKSGTYSQKARFGAFYLLILAGAMRMYCAPQELPDAPKPAGQQQASEAGKQFSSENCKLRNAAATKSASSTLCVPYLPVINWYARFVSGPHVKPLTPLQKAQLAGRNLIDPYNLATIVGEAAIAVGTNSHSPEGPGLQGIGNYIGVSFTQDMVGEFFGTFLIPSIAHQDPRYHRMPEASIKRRVFHCIEQVAWTQGDNGSGMVNYADLVGFAVENKVNNLYVPGQETDLRANAVRYGTSLGLAPVDNLITEFLPDVARRLHVRVVLVQRIINHVARVDGAPAP